MERAILFNKLLEITDMQYRVLENEDIDTFNELLEDRQRIIEQINAIENLVLEDYEKEIIYKIKKQDKEHMVIVSKLYSKLQLEVKSMRQAQRSVMSYENGYGPIDTSGYYYDKK